MAVNKQLIAKVLEVEATRSNLYDEQGETYGFKVLEFPNGLILVPGDTTNDWFFDDRDSIEACGCDIVTSIEETGKTQDWTAQELLKSVQGSMSEFGIDSVHQKHLELWRK